MRRELGKDAEARRNGDVADTVGLQEACQLAVGVGEASSVEGDEGLEIGAGEQGGGDNGCQRGDLRAG